MFFAEIILLFVKTISKEKCLEILWWKISCSVKKGRSYCEATVLTPAHCWSLVRIHQGPALSVWSLCLCGLSLTSSHSPQTCTLHTDGATANHRIETGNLLCVRKHCLTVQHWAGGRVRGSYEYFYTCVLMLTYNSYMRLFAFYHLSHCDMIRY